MSEQRDKIIRFLTSIKSKGDVHMHCYSGSLENQINLTDELNDYFENDEDENKYVVQDLNLMDVDGNPKAFYTELFCEHFKKMEKIKSVKEFAKFLETSIFKKPVDRVIFILRNAEAITDFKIDFVTSLFAINDYLGDKIVLFVTLSSRKWTCILSEFKHLGTMPQNVDLFRAEKTKIRDHLSETILEQESPRRREMFLNGFIETAWLIVNNDDQLRLLCHKSYELFNCSKTKNSREVCNIVKDVINNTYKTPNSGLNDDKIELPTIAKYCIIAAYCASFNPPTSDKQFFSCENHKQKKTNLTIKKEIDLKLQEQGPKLFTEDRFRMIFYNLISRDESIDASQIGSQQTLETLCNVALLARSAKQTNFKSPKYRSVTSFEFTSKLAESVDLDLKQCMYAYNS